MAKGSSPAAVVGEESTHCLHNEKRGKTEVVRAEVLMEQGLQEKDVLISLKCLIINYWSIYR